MSECCCGSNCESVTKEVNGKIESIKVLGSGCKNCHAFHQNVIDALAEMNLAVNLEYVTDMQKIMEAGVMSMPALMVNDKVVSCGKVLKVDEVKKIAFKKIELFLLYRSNQNELSQCKRMYVSEANLPESRELL